MRRVLFAGLLAFAGVVQTAAAATIRVGTASETCSLPDYATIQAAVDAASSGDTIEVCAGTYSELVTVDKSVTLLGAQSGVDARTRSAVAESVVNGNSGSTSFHVTASDVTIDGFTIEGNTSVQFGAGVVLGGATSGSSLFNNIIQNNIIGIAVANASDANPTVIQHNLIRNNNQPGGGSGHGIYTDNFLAGETVDNVLIDSNRFTGNSVAAIGFDSTDPSKPATNITVSNNELDGNGRGITAFNLTSSSITHNLFENSTFAASADLRIFEGTSDVTVDGNTFSGNATIGRAVRFSNAGTGAGNATNVAFALNSFTGYTTAETFDAGQYSGTVDAECNWWGSATGPSHSSNPGGTGSSVSDDVDFDPWLDTALEAWPAAAAGVCVGGGTLAVTAGNNQTATVDTAYATALEVTLTDSGGNPLSNVEVTFTAVAGGNGASGTFGGATTVSTDANGIATAPQLTANTIAGAFTVTAMVSTLTATLDLTNVAGTTSSLAIWQGDDQAATVNTAFATALAVAVADSFGNPIAGASVTFTPFPGANGASATFTGPSTVDTDANGLATAPALTANTIAGSFTVEATGNGFSVTFDETNLAGPPAAVSEVSGEGASVFGGKQFPPLSVLITDSFGNPISGVPVTFTAPSSGPGGTFEGDGTSVVVNTGADGIATAPPFTANFLAGPFEVTAEASAGTVTFQLAVSAHIPTLDMRSLAVLALLLAMAGSWWLRGS